MTKIPNMGAGIGVVILSIAASLLTKANRKTSSFITAVTTKGTFVYGNFTTTANSCAAYFITGNGVRQTLFTAITVAHKAYIVCH